MGCYGEIGNNNSSIITSSSVLQPSPHFGPRSLCLFSTQAIRLVVSLLPRWAVNLLLPNRLLRLRVLGLGWGLVQKVRS